MVSGLNNTAIRFVTYLVYILLALLTLTTGWQAVTLGNMPDKYVRLERYNSDQNKICAELTKLDTKLDRLLALFLPPKPGH